MQNDTDQLSVLPLIWGGFPERPSPAGCALTEAWEGSPMSAPAWVPTMTCRTMSTIPRQVSPPDRTIPREVSPADRTFQGTSDSSNGIVKLTKTV